MAVNINVPSQVKTYANLAAFPATGALKTIYIAEDTNKTYRWTGSVYTEISASAAMTWGAIGGTLSNQTDLQSALDAKVPTSRTLTINGVTQDLSADRTFTISTGITIGTTAITSGVVGRVLFQGTGNVVQQSSSLFWDATNNRLGIGTSAPASTFEVVAGSDANGIKLRGRSADNISNFFFSSNDGLSQYGYFQHRSSVMRVVNNVGDLEFWNGPNIGSTVQRATLFGATGNLAINTTTDAGFRLDVNGTARVSGDVLLTTGILASTNGTTRLQSVLNFFSHNRLASSGVFGWDIRVSNNQHSFWTYDGASGNTRFGSNAYGVEFYTNNTLRTTMTSGGNWLINTTTDAGFRLDVNGTARVSPIGTQTGTLYITAHGTYVNRGRLSVGGSGDGANTQSGLNFSANSGTGKTYIDGWNDGGSNQYDIVVGSVGSRIQFGTDSASIASAQVTINSTTRGFLPPRMTTTQKNAIASPAAGLMVYDTTLNVISYYNGTMWI